LLHTSVPLHIVVHEPQCIAVEPTQLPLHESRPGLQTHWPASQSWPLPQAFPQAPQFWALLATGVHVVPHIIWPAAQLWPSTLPWQPDAATAPSRTSKASRDALDKRPICQLLANMLPPSRSA
jgi:hypothetical protein